MTTFSYVSSEQGIPSELDVVETKSQPEEQNISSEDEVPEVGDELIEV